MIDFSLPYCTYISKHQSGFEYRGKGVTKLVLAGKYKGSGTRFRLSCMNPGFELDTWTTTVQNTFYSSNDAYCAEAELVTLEDLRNPYLMNDTAGGRKGKYQTRSTLMRSFVSAKRVLNKTKKKEAEKAKTQKLKDQIRNLKK